VTCRLTLAFALTVTPTAAAAQLSDVGIGVALSHHQWLDVPSLCCPPLAWATFGEGRWRLQVDYLRSYGEGDGHGNHPLDPVDGRRASRTERSGCRLYVEVLSGWAHNGYAPARDHLNSNLSPSELRHSKRQVGN